MMTTDIATTVATTSAISRYWSGKESLFPWIPKPVKLLILLIFILNAKSWPFVWHVKVWYPAIRAHILARRLGLKTYYKALKIGIPLTSSTSKSSVDAGTTSFEVEKGVYKPNEDDVKRAVQIGRGHKFEHPMGVVSVKKFRAGFDDCDYNYHLSNSSYAKNLDSARMKACIENFSPLFAPGGWMALGAAHYQYLKEIPLFAEYETQFSIGGFEEKWIYLVAEFVTYPKGKKSDRPRRSKSVSQLSKLSPTDALSGHQAPHTDGSAARINGNANSNGNGNVNVDAGVTTEGVPADLKERIAKDVTGKKREDGSVLHCFSVSVYVFKIGRITVPPRVALSFCGYGDPSNWKRAEHLICNTKDRGRKWLQGGWKDEPDVVGGAWIGESDEGGAEGDDDRALFARGMKEGAKLKEGLEGLRAVVGEVPKMQ